MEKKLAQVAAFHKKFAQPILAKRACIPEDRSMNRYRLMREEVEEYKTAVTEADLPAIAKELADILYATYGTILEHGLQDDIETVFAEVHRSNMSKTASRYKMVKGQEYSEARIDSVFK